MFFVLGEGGGLRLHGDVLGYVGEASGEGFLEFGVFCLSGS